MTTTKSTEIFTTRLGFDQVEVDQLRTKSSWLGIIGALLLLLGVYASIHFWATTIASLYVLGVILLIGGCIETANAILARSWNIALLDVLMAVLYIVAGVFTLRQPETAGLTLTLLLSAVFIVNGLMRILSTFALKPPHWAWILLHGTVSFLIGVLLLAQWPWSGIWAIGVFVGVDLIVIGASMIATSITLRRHAQDIGHGITSIGSRAA